MAVNLNAATIKEDSSTSITIQSSGADSKRPIVLREKDGKWYLWENLLLADIRKPARISGW